MTGFEPAMIFQFTKLVFSTTQLTTALNFLCLFIYNNNLSYVIIALWVLYSSITPTDQSIDFPSLYLWLLAVAQQMEFQARLLSSLSVSEITTSSTPF